MPVAPPPTEAVTLSDAAQAVVRRYLDALIAGNESAAYAALGGTAQDEGLSLKEEAFIDRDTRIVSVRTRSVNAGGVTVAVELSSDGGDYDAIYHVVSNGRGTYIDQHDYIKE